MTSPTADELPCSDEDIRPGVPAGHFYAWPFQILGAVLNVRDDIFRLRELAKVLPKAHDAINQLATSLENGVTPAENFLRATSPTNVDGPLAGAIHYPKCWDLAAYPTLESALSEVYAWFKCNECAKAARSMEVAAPVMQNVLPNGGRHLAPMIRVACITLDGSTLTVPAKDLEHHIAMLDDSFGDHEGDQIAYTLTFKTMLVRDYEALGEFDGF